MSSPGVCSSLLLCSHSPNDVPPEPQRNLSIATVRSAVRPSKVCTSVWDPKSILLQDELEKVQKRAARFVTGNYVYETGNMTGILKQLKRESLKKRPSREGLQCLNSSNPSLPKADK